MLAVLCGGGLLVLGCAWLSCGNAPPYREPARAPRVASVSSGSAPPSAPSASASAIQEVAPPDDGAHEPPPSEGKIRCPDARKPNSKDQQCDAATEECCQTGRYHEDVVCTPAPTSAEDEALLKACAVHEMPYTEVLDEYKGAPHPILSAMLYTQDFGLVTRCAGSKDCAGATACCSRQYDGIDGILQLARCLPADQLGQPSCEDELCDDRAPCRTPGAVCDRSVGLGVGRWHQGYCRKPVKDPSVVCQTAADCLPGEVCVHDEVALPEAPHRACVGHAFTRRPCETAAECADYCSDKRAACKPAIQWEAPPRRGGRAEPFAPGLRWCECPRPARR